MEEIVLDSTYRVIEEIGRGGGGIVYKAYHERLKKYVVLKQIKSSAAALLDARNEVDLLKGLKHTYLPQVLDFIEYNGVIFTVMDFIDGKDLSKYHKDKSLKAQEIINISTQLCEAVKYLHSQNPPVIHSDIKPANIMITERGDICLIDFNISLVFGKGNGAIGGTKGYASPEQFGLLKDNAAFTASINARKGTSAADSTAVRNAIDERADIYAIGAVMYRMITGEVPAADFGSIKSVRDYGAKVPEGLFIIVEKAMSYNPADRYSSAAEMLDALNNVMKLDKRYRALKVQRVIVSAVCSIGMLLSAISTNYGLSVIEEERETKYLEYIDEADNAINDNDFDDAEDAIEDAMDFMPQRPEAYYENIFLKYKLKEYEDCIEYYENHRATLDEESFELKSNMYFVLGNAHLELENYASAVLQYNKSLELNDERTDCYRDLAISYARLKQTKKASRILEKAIKAELSNDQILLMKGEIEISNGNYEEALSLLEAAAAETDDSYLHFRSIMVYVNLCDEELFDGAHSLAAEFLENNLSKTAPGYEAYMNEMLGNQYSLLGRESGNEDYYRRAISCYSQLILNATQKYIIYKNCFELQYLLKDYSNCEWTLDRMDEKFPDDYWVAMNRTYLLIDIQSNFDVSERTYDEAYSYYKKAEELYAVYTENGKSDPNMEMLGNYIDQLKEAGWISG